MRKGSFGATYFLGEFRNSRPPIDAENSNAARGENLHGSKFPKFELKNMDKTSKDIKTQKEGNEYDKHAEKQRSGAKFTLLMWKNYKILMKNKTSIGTAFILPLTIILPMLFLRLSHTPENHEDGIVYEPFDLNLDYTIQGPRSIMLYSPCNENLDKIMKTAASGLVNDTNSVKAICVDNGSLLQKTIATEPFRHICGIQFDDQLRGNVALPKNINMVFRYPAELKIRTSISDWSTKHIFPPVSVAGPRDHGYKDGAFPSYHKEGFLAIQKSVSLSFIQHFKQRDNPSQTPFNPPEITMARFPYTPWFSDMIITQLKSYLGIFFVIAFLSISSLLVTYVTDEKESQVKEAMKIMGLPNWLHWLSWFVTGFLLLFLLALILFIGTKFPNLSILTLLNTFVYIVYLSLYCCASVALGLAISVCFTNGTVASVAALLIWIIFLGPYFLILQKLETRSFTEKLLSCVCSNSAFCLGFLVILNYEEQGEGSDWSNLFTPNSQEETITVGVVMIMLILDTFIYLCLALYIDCVYPGAYGIPKPWYFPFTKSFWCGSSKYSEADSNLENSGNSELFEAEPKNLKKGAEVKHLRKVYGKNVAVKDFSLNMYQDQITVLLGHNGAGKTTTMSMLTGMITPTSGTAIINGYDIVHNMDKVRNSLGLCPQYNIIFKELTVYDHLYLFGKLKGLSGKEIKPEVTRYLKLLDLEEKKNTQASKLSGGMKRRLCIGISLCGKSKVVFLDEPTAGVDPAARRVIWNLMQKEKKGRTILLTTHFMDEADLLGDRIAIMSAGKLQCCGTSFFLKKKFGSGYRLVMEKDKNCNVNEVTAALRRFIPGIKLENSVGSELTYSLSDQNTNAFEPMLKELETRGDQLGVRNFGISLTTMEEVFLKTGADQDQNELNKAGQKQQTTYAVYKIDEDHYETGMKLLIVQIYAMFVKRFLSTLRAWVLLLAIFLIPILFLLPLAFFGTKEDTKRDLPSMDIALGQYQDPIVLVTGPSENPYKKSYIDIVNADGEVKDFGGRDMVKTALSVAEEGISRYRNHYVIGASFTDNRIIGWFNNEPYHTPPLALSTIISSILKAELSSEYDITITNYPMPFNLNTQFTFTEMKTSQLYLLMPMIMCCIASYFIIFPIKERATGAKHLQLVSGARISTLWIVSYMWDYFIYIIICIICIIVIFFIKDECFTTSEELEVLFLILILFGFAVLPVIYIFSYIFNVPSVGFVMVVNVLLIGTIGLVVVPLLVMFSETLGDVCHHIFLIFPPYCLGSAMVHMKTLCSELKKYKAMLDYCKVVLKQSEDAACVNLICNGYPHFCDVDENYLAWKEPGILKHILYFLLVGIFFIMLIIFKECGYIRFVTDLIIRMFVARKATKDEQEEDSDVTAERNKVNNMKESEIKQYSLGLHDVTKYYCTFLAVNKISLLVPKGECFGLLGVNGAGKTTTFKMMSGQEHITSGNIWVLGMNVKKKLKEIYKVTGYCPQFDALFDDLTGRETLIIFCLLRGVKYNEAKYLAEKFAREFDFYAHIDKKVKQFSGGNKRKLSTALALLSDPQIIYLDEPTTGMDPVTKRHVWDNVNKVRDSGKTIILTSHSMDECEALCTRLAIMVNGQFKCLGSTQRLKSKFSQGYSLIIKLKKTKSGDVLDEDIASVKNFVEKNFRGAVLKESFQEMLSYYIADASTPWSKMFSLMEQAKSRLNIEDYSLGQCRLEEVFLHFTEHQKEDKRKP